MKKDSPLHHEPFLEQLFALKIIDQKLRQEMLERCYPSPPWITRAILWLRVFGITLLLASAFFFFAYNWHSMPSWFKLATTETLLIIALALAYTLGINSKKGHLALLSGTLLVGLFLAVFGQTYQTGADSYMLFTAWAALTMPWVMLSRRAPNWLAWIVVINLAAFFYGDQEFAHQNEFFIIYTALALLNSFFLLLKEAIAFFKKQPWLSGRYSRIALTIAALGFIYIPIIITMFDAESMPPYGGWIWLVNLLMHLLIFWFFILKQADPWPVITATLSIAAQIELLLIKYWEHLDADDSGFLLIALFSLINFTLAGLTLKKLLTFMERRHVS
ncbi:DUF2157 domain-containing protein [Magnetococcales bacterium HHB-1]